MHAYRIAELSQRTGFPASTLRYYEGIGLLPAAQRSPAGYRVYHDDAVERLAFVARAKQLGCSLEEIAELVRAREGGDCGLVQGRLQQLVTAKLTESQERAGELVAFVGQLEGAAAQLSAPPSQGPCDDRCACSTAPSPPAPVRADRDADDGVGPAVACSLSAAEMPGRIADWQRLMRHAVRRVALAGGWRVELDEHMAVGELAELVVAEQRCCTFFSFALISDVHGLALEVRAPVEALPLVEALLPAAS